MAQKFKRLHNVSVAVVKPMRKRKEKWKHILKSNAKPSQPLAGVKRLKMTTI